MRALLLAIAALLLPTAALAQQVDPNVAPPALANEFGPGTYVTNNVVQADHLIASGQPHTDMEEIAGGDNVGAFRFLCGPAGLVTDDPLVLPDQFGMSHLHQLYGNSGMNAASTYTTFRTIGHSTCQNDLNLSGYWQPGLLNGKGQAIPPDFVSVYYKRFPQSRPECTSGSGVYAGRCVGTPTALRYIFGYDLVSGTVPSGGRAWKCVYNHGQSAGNFDNLVDAAHSCLSLPQDGVLQLALTINAPQCWDGKNLDSPNHRSHVADATFSNGSSGRFACDAAHPYVIPTYQATSFWTINSTLDMSGVWNPNTWKSWRLSSDKMPAMNGMAAYNLKPGFTAHFDYFEAWDQPTKALWLHNCIDRGLTCGAGDLGNGQQLKQENPALAPDHMPIPVPVIRPKMAFEAVDITVSAPQ